MVQDVNWHELTILRILFINVSATGLCEILKLNPLTIALTSLHGTIYVSKRSSAENTVIKSVMNKKISWKILYNLFIVFQCI